MNPQYTSPFDYMKPSEELQVTIKTVREAYKNMHTILLSLPHSRERSVAITELETSAMWAIKGLVFNDPNTTTPDNN